MELSSRMGRNVAPEIADACETAASEFITNLTKGLMPINRPMDISGTWAAELSRELGESFELSHTRRNIDVVWVSVPRVSPVAATVRIELTGHADNDMDGMLWAGFQSDVLEGNQFDVYEYYAKLRFSFLDRKEWAELGDELRDGFINMARQDVTEAIQASAGY